MNGRTALGTVMIVGLNLVGAGRCGADAGNPNRGDRTVIPYKGGSGNEHGYRVLSPVYEATLSCNRDYGFSVFLVSMAGETVARTTRFSIHDEHNECAFDAFQFHQDKAEVTVTSVPGRISWALSPAFAKTKGVEYRGSVAYGTRQISLTHFWICHRRLGGRVLAGNLQLGIPLLTMCRFDATLADGSTVHGEIPAELPGGRLLLTPDEAGKAITSIQFDTRKGKVRIAFLPDQYLDMTRGNLLHLQTVLHPESQSGGTPYRRYELALSFPLGETKDVPRSYSIVFEFPE